MAEFFGELSDKHIAFINAQHVFFVASAPVTGGHVNLSPKGGDTFRVLSPRTACYLDMTGSGNETAAHIRQNGRVTVMFCSFDRMAQILRLYGSGSVVARGSDDYAALSRQFPEFLGARQIICFEIEMVQTSCGYQVPMMEYIGERNALIKWSESKGADGLRDYRAKKNMISLDGLPTGFVES